MQVSMADKKSFNLVYMINQNIIKRFAFFMNIKNTIFDVFNSIFYFKMPPYQKEKMSYLKKEFVFNIDTQIG